MDFESNGLRLHYELHGDEVGRPIVLVHGWGMSCRVWDVTLPVLLDAGHEVIGTHRMPQSANLVRKLGATPVMLDLRDADAVRRAIADLPVEFREIVILREMEGFSYKEIADLAEVPIGTVMSRLARARKLLQKRLTTDFKPGNH